MVLISRTGVCVAALRLMCGWQPEEGAAWFKVGSDAMRRNHTQGRVGGTSMYCLCLPGFESKIAFEAVIAMKCVLI